GPGIFRAGNATFLPGTTLRIELNGLVAGTGYDRLQVDGSANIAGANLVLTNATGTFSGLPQGTAIVTNGVRYRISYTGGDGNDVALIVDGPPSIGAI